MGLLSKASSITTVTKLAFSQFIISHKIHFFAVFQLTGNYYTIKNSIGFDGTSLLSSNSTKDFWNGICEYNKKIYSFNSEDKTINPMLQFFSFDLMDKIKSVSLYKIDNIIYMLCNKDFDDSIIIDLENIDYEANNINLTEINKAINSETRLLKYEINFSEAVSSFLSVKAKECENKDEVKAIILKELINRFSCFLCKYSTLKENENTIKVIFTTDKYILDEHLICHVVYNLRKVLGTNAEMITFNSLGTIDTIAEIKSFLQVE